MRSIKQRRTSAWTGFPVPLRGAMALASLMAGGLTGCGSIEAVSPNAGVISDPAQVYMRLVLNHPAVNLATTAGYNTVQLAATPLDALGNPMLGVPAPTYVSEDTNRIKVTADGHVTAVAVTAGANVIASLQIGPVTWADTAVVAVKSFASSPPALGQISIHPIPPDSAVLWRSGALHPGLNSVAAATLSFVFLQPTRSTPRLFDTLGGGISTSGMAVEYRSLDPSMLDLGRRDGRWSANSIVIPGTARIVARTFAYGIAKADTVLYTITAPVVADVWNQPDAGGVPVFWPEQVRITPYGMVIWNNKLSGDSVDIVFDDTTHVITPPFAVCNRLEVVAVGTFGPGPHCGAGNVMLPPNVSDDERKTVQVRQFTAPGIYIYRSTRTGASGRIVVNRDYSDPPSL